MADKTSRKQRRTAHRGELRWGGIEPISTVLDLGKRAYELAKKANNIELYETIMELREAALATRQELVELREYSLRLESLNKELQRNTELIATLKRKGSFYFAEDDDAPYCSRCIEVERLPVHVLKTTKLEVGRRIWECPKCNTKSPMFNEGPGA